MPTGYTTKLENKELDTKTWIMEHLARAFGMCVTLREDNHKTEAEIIDILEADTSQPHYEKGLKEATAQLKEYKHFEVEDWNKEIKGKNQETDKYNAEKKEECAERKQKHDKTRKELTKVLNGNVSEVTRNIIKFGLEQLNVVKSETVPYLDEKISDWKAYKDKSIEDAEWSVNYNEKELVKAKERVEGRLEMYMQLRKDIDKYLK